MAPNRIERVGLLTQADVERLGAQFSKLFPAEEVQSYGDLLRVIDDTDRRWRLHGGVAASA